MASNSMSMHQSIDDARGGNNYLSKHDFDSGSGDQEDSKALFSGELSN